MKQSEITQGGINEHITDTGYDRDLKSSPAWREIIAAECMRFRLGEYGEQPVHYDTADELFALWPDEPIHTP